MVSNTSLYGLWNLGNLHVKEVVSLATVYAKDMTPLVSTRADYSFIAVRPLDSCRSSSRRHVRRVLLQRVSRRIEQREAWRRGRSARKRAKGPSVASALPATMAVGCCLPRPQTNGAYSIYEAYIKTLDAYTQLTVKFSNSVRDAQVVHGDAAWCRRVQAGPC